MDIVKLIQLQPTPAVGFLLSIKAQIRTNNSIIQKIELLVLDLIEPIVHIYLVDNKKAQLLWTGTGLLLNAR